LLAVQGHYEQVNKSRNNGLSVSKVIGMFLESRREGLSSRTIEFYSCYLTKSIHILGLTPKPDKVSSFFNRLNCSKGGKHAYFRVMRVFYNWLYSVKSGCSFDPQDNPIRAVDPPKVENKILPSLNTAQLDYLIAQARCVRDKAIISLFADSGLRLSELTNIKTDDIDWHNRLIRVWCKGRKEGLAPFGERTEQLLEEWLSQYKSNGRLWDLNTWGIVEMLKQLRARTGLPCNPHTFRRTFASILAKRGVDSLHIKRLGRWESIQMVDRYTKSVQFEDSLKFYKGVLS